MARYFLASGSTFSEPSVLAENLIALYVTDTPL